MESGERKPSSRADSSSQHPDAGQQPNSAERLPGGAASPEDADEQERAQHFVQQAARVLEGVTDAVFALNRDWRLTYANPFALRATGLSAEEIVGQELWALYPQLKGTPVEAAYHKAMQQREPVHVEIQGLISGAWYDTHIYPTENGLAVYVRDITERKRTEEALRQSEERFRQLADAMPQLVWTAAPDGTVDYYNNRAETFSGLSQRADGGWDWMPMVHPEDRLRTARVWEEALATGAGYDVEHRLRRSDGRYRWHLSRGLPVRDAEGQITRWYGTATDIHHQKETEEALRASEQAARARLDELEAIYATAPVGLCVFDTELRFMRINKRLAEINGPSPEEHFGRTIRDVVPDLAEQAEAFLERILETGEPIRDIEIIGETTAQPGRERCWVESWFPIWDEQGQLVGINVVAEEVTERKQAAEALRRSEGRLAAAVEIAQLGIWEYDPATGMTHWDERCREIFGIPGTHFSSNEEVFALIHPKDRPRVEEEVQAALDPQGRGRYETEYRILRPGGTQRWLAVRGNALTSGMGAACRIERFVGTLKDITERKQAEEAVRERERQLALVIDTAPAFIAHCDRAGHFQFVNRAYAARFGLQPSDVMGKHISEVLGLAAYEAVKPHIEEVLAGRTVEFDTEVVLPNLGQRYMHARYAPERDAHGTVSGFVAVVNDVTERKQAEEELRRAKEAAEAANRAKSVFLANMSHEIRTPLTGIIGFANILKRTVVRQARNYAERIERSGKRLLETLDAVLTLARLEAGRTEMTLQPVEVAAEVEEVVALFRPEAVEKGLTCTFTVTEAARSAQARLDRGALTSILQNLLSNAIKYTDEGGLEVTVELDERSSPERVLIAVEDTGIGIAPKVLARIYEPFVQESTGFSRTHEGSGLGLSIVRQLTEKMAGTVEVESEKGRGSRFTIAFPHWQQEPAQAELTADARDGAVGTARRPRLLVVDDHEDSRVLLEALLRERYKVVLYPHADGALEAARQAAEAGRPFDLVLLDINLGDGQSGTDLLQKLRGTGAYAAVPVGALTAYALPGDRERFLENGFDGYLRKPFTQEELIGLTERLLH